MLFGGILAGMFSAPPAHAAVSDEYDKIRTHGIIFANVCDGSAYNSPCDCRDDGDCSVQDIMQVIANISYFILAISGTLTFVAFVYGGVLWVAAAGNGDMIKKGQSALTSAVVGLAIIFGAYVFITLLIGILRTGEVPTGTLEDTIEGSADQVIDTQ